MRCDHGVVDDLMRIWLQNYQLFYICATFFKVLPRFLTKALKILYGEILHSSCFRGERDSCQNDLSAVGSPT